MIMLSVYNIRADVSVSMFSWMVMAVAVGQDLQQQGSGIRGRSRKPTQEKSLGVGARLEQGWS